MTAAADVRRSISTFLSGAIYMGTACWSTPYREHPLLLGFIAVVLAVACAVGDRLVYGRGGSC